MNSDTLSSADAAIHDINVRSVKRIAENAAKISRKEFLLEIQAQLQKGDDAIDLLHTQISTLERIDVDERTKFEKSFLAAALRVVK